MSKHRFDKELLAVLSLASGIKVKNLRPRINKLATSLNVDLEELLKSSTKNVCVRE